MRKQRSVNKKVKKEQRVIYVLVEGETEESYLKALKNFLKLKAQSQILWDFGYRV